MSWDEWRESDVLSERALPITTHPSQCVSPGLSISGIPLCLGARMTDSSSAHSRWAVEDEGWVEKLRRGASRFLIFFLRRPYGGPCLFLRRLIPRRTRCRKRVSSARLARHGSIRRRSVARSRDIMHSQSRRLTQYSISIKFTQSRCGSR